VGDAADGTLRRLAGVWLAVATFLLLAVSPSIRAEHARALSVKLLVTQDLPILLPTTFAWAVLFLSPWLRRRLRQAMIGLADRQAVWSGRALAHAPLVVLALALACLVLCAAGARWSPVGYPFSIEEFLANFDAEILRHGRAMAPVAPLWRPYVPALQPMFVLATTGGAYWASAYLPVAALFRALAGSLVSAELANPVWSAVSVAAIFGVAGRLWPRRPDIGLAAAVLLAASSQFLVTAMTSYAMPAHLALNLVWLWLFLRGGRLGHAGAIAVAFAACGLHQLPFHPLFAAPFVAQLWLERRWRSAAAYTLAYAAICLFWVFYWNLVLGALGTAEQGALVGGASGFFARAFGLIKDFDLGDLGLMAMNLVRFVTWQDPLLTPLGLIGGAAAIRARGPLRSLALGIVLTTAAMGVVLAYQGYGSGYRYLHGLLGSACLIAAWAWVRLIEPFPEAERRAAWAGFAGIAAASLLILLPARLAQAAAWARPYVAASAAIASTPADVVIIDERGIQFGRELVRNDPFLRNRPIVVDLAFLSAAQVRDLHARYRVALFDQKTAARLGVPVFNAAPASSRP
jgi:hypothetical protein